MHIPEQQQATNNVCKLQVERCTLHVERTIHVSIKTDRPYNWPSRRAKLTLQVIKLKIYRLCLTYRYNFRKNIVPPTSINGNCKKCSFLRILSIIQSIKSVTSSFTILRNICLYYMYVAIWISIVYNHY